MSACSSPDRIFNKKNYAKTKNSVLTDVLQLEIFVKDRYLKKFIISKYIEYKYVFF